MNTHGTLKLLVVGYETWSNKFSKQFDDVNKYHLEIINNPTYAMERLHHNSYDILLLEEEYFKANSIELSKLSYAMSRPSIILCKSYFKYLMYTLWKYCSDWTNLYKTSRQLIHIKMQSDKHIKSQLPHLLHCHSLIKNISSEIRSTYKSIH